MTGVDPWTVRCTLAWVDLYTRTAPADDADGRRAEVASDIHEQFLAARDLGVPDRVTARELALRSLRGVPADLAWRIEVEQVPGRLSWHVDHPATFFGVALLVLVPLGVVADTLRGGTLDWRAAGLVGLAAVLGSVLVCAVAAVSFVRRCARRGSGERWTALRFRRFLIAAMCISWAVSGLWRFVPDSLGAVAALAWAVFGLALAAYLAARLVGGVGALGRRSDVAGSRILDFGKVPS